MEIKTQMYNLSNLSTERTLRFDIKFLKFNTRQSVSTGYYTFNDLFKVVSPTDVQDLSSFKYAEIGNVEKDGSVEPISLNMDNIDGDLINANYYKKISKGDIFKPELNSVLISSVRPNLRKFVLVNRDISDIYFTKAFIQIYSTKLNSLVMYHALRTILFNNINSVSRLGKGYPTLNCNDLRYIVFNKTLIDSLLEKQHVILQKINNIEAKIKEKKFKIKKSESVINEIFNKKFHLNCDQLHELKKERYNHLTLSDFSNNKDLRNSCKFHSKSAQYAMTELCSITSKKIKHYISEPIVLGESISPKDYDENGKYRYLSMASIKTWQYDENAAQTVSKFYSDSTIKKVQKGDIVLARSGEGTIGKVAIINNDINAIFCDFTMRIRLKEYNSLFAYYYFRTDFFQELIFGYKKGLGNNTNIFPIQIQEFPIPDISLKEQQKIVDEIKSELDKQDAIKSEITDLRNSIEKIIEQSIKL